MKSGLREGAHDLPPAERQLRKAVQEQQERSARAVESRFEDMGPQAARFHEPGPHPRRQMLSTQRHRMVIGMLDQVLGPRHFQTIPQSASLLTLGRSALS